MPHAKSSHLSVSALLERIGLSTRERDIYMATLALKSARVVNIAKLAKQSRSHAYLMLRLLAEKGLVSEVDQGGVLRFVAEPVEHLVAYLLDREEEYRELRMLTEGALPLLRNLSVPSIHEPRITLLHGLDGMKQIYRNIFAQEFCALFNPTSMYRAFGKNIVPSLLRNGQTSLRGRDLIVDTAMTQRYIQETSETKEYTMRVLPKNMQFDTDTLIYGDTVAIVTFDTNLTILRIENANIATALRCWFEELWAGAKPVRKS